MEQEVFLVLTGNGVDDLAVTGGAQGDGPAIDARRRRVELVRRTLASRGLVEAVTFSFISSRMAELFGGAKPELRLVNPISAELDAMRPSVLPGLVEAARRNADRGFPDVALFELGPLYRDDTSEGQVTVAAGLRAGRLVPRHWQQPPREADLYTAKADAVAALAAMGAPVENIQATVDFLGCQIFPDHILTGA